MTLASRMVWVLTGLAWAATSLIAFAGPEYWDPVTPLDWTAIWVYSLAWLLMAPSILLIARLRPTRSVLAAAAIVSIGAVMASGANALEDAFDMGSMSTWYVVGFLTGWLAMVPLAIALGHAGRWRLAGVEAAIFTGILLFNVGGGLIVLAALGSLALALDWFARRWVQSEPPVASPAS